MTPSLRFGSSVWIGAAFGTLSVLASVLGGCGSDVDGVEELAPLATGSQDIVISQLYGGGGNSGAQFTNDFVELFNRSTASVSITGWSVQYASTSGNSWAAAKLSGTIPAGGYYLVQLAAGSGTAASLPTPDATGAMNMSGTTGKVALVTSTTLLSCGSGTACLPNTSIRDFVGYGTADNSEGNSDAPTLSNSTSGFRLQGGCTDTNVNSADFTTGAPSPRNSRSPLAPCGSSTPPPPVDAGAPPPVDGGAPPPVDGGGTTTTGDGTPTRKACTNTFGSQMSATFGRLDGFLVSIVKPGTSSCSGDSGHIHLQVQMNNAVYNIAVNVMSNSGNPDVDFRTLNHALVGNAWSEGWHTGASLDYANTLGVTSGSFTEMTEANLASLVESDLANANHVSIFTTGFDSTGGDLVHREGSNHDGAIVINPTTSSPEYLLFHFTNQSF